MAFLTGVAFLAGTDLAAGAFLAGTDLAVAFLTVASEADFLAAVFGAAAFERVTDFAAGAALVAPADAFFTAVNSISLADQPVTPGTVLRDRGTGVPPTSTSG